ncbi:hypothetical protein [Sphingosinicella humi]|uniref:VanZ-like domain-containing protein n=1 Tax=Allosphingosinicella humi TaxID=2068657 RepID=A0A2U2J1V4_9SPHN|nr:hypothetical protein [Sphingosinicella humi]PWG02327.1 hypothetical protein DF286_05215 [Sphingosinicella humi]
MEIIARYAALKNWLGDYTGASEGLLHVHFGLIIFVVTALLLKRRMRSPWPLVAVAFFGIANEVVDYIGPEPWPLWGSIADVLNTLVWPFMLFLMARRGRNIGNKVGGQ